MKCAHTREAAAQPRKQKKIFNIFKRVKDTLSQSDPHFLLMIPVCKIKSYG